MCRRAYKIQRVAHCQRQGLIVEMDENPFRRPPLPPLPPISQPQYLSFLPPPSYEEIMAEQRRYRQQKRQQLLQAGYRESQIIFSDEGQESYEDEPSSIQDSYSQSQNSNDIHDRRTNDQSSRSTSHYTHPAFTSKSIPSSQQQVEQQPPSQVQFQLDQQTQKLLLIHEYLQVSSLTQRMITSPKINKLLTSDEFVDSHSLQQIQQYINSLTIPSAPTWQQQVNTRQARGEGVFVSEAAMWDLEQEILRMLREQGQSRQ